MNIWQWQDKTHVIADFPNGAQIRLTIGACSGYENGLHAAYTREIGQHIKDIYGIDELEFIKTATQEQRTELGCYYQRAIMLATLLAVETRETENDEWKPDELPAEWRAIATFSRNVPISLFDLWLVAAVELNPGVFIRQDTDDEKKIVRANAQKLTN